MRRLACRWILVLITALVLAPLPARASLRVASDDALARSSAAAVHGRVVAVTAAWDAAADTIYSYVTLDVLRAWGLPGAPMRVTVKQLGGVVGDTAFVVGGQARFAVGEEVLVFLDVRPRDNTLSVAGLEQGKWILTGASDARTAALREVRGADQVSVVARDYRTLAELDALAALAGTRVSAAAAVLSPALPDAPRGGPYYTLLGSTPARWQQADSGLPVYVDTQSGGFAQFAGGGLQQLANAASIWRAAGSLSLQNGVARTARCFNNSEAGDGRISVTYNDPCGEIADASSTLAIGGAYYTSAGAKSVNGVTYWSMTKGMIIVDNVASKYSGMTTGCYEEMLVHELGHAIGFGHAAARPAIMYPSISSACYGRTVSAPLGADDLAGMAAVYPGAPVGVTPPNAPTALTASVSGSTVTFNWTLAATGAAATGVQLQAGSTPGGAEYGAVVVGGTSVSVPNVPNGVYYVRARAVNAAGASAPTADAVATVGTAPPGTPRNVSATVTGGVTTISWQPPATGGTPTGYVIVAGYSPGASTFQVPISGTSASGVIGAATYYVRIVAVNGAGPGPASAEVTLVVP